MYCNFEDKHDYMMSVEYRFIIYFIIIDKLLIEDKKRNVISHVNNIVILFYITNCRNETNSTI